MRSILLRLEAAPAGEHIEVGGLLDLDSSREVIAEHVGLMADAGLLSVIDTSTMDGRDYLIRQLTWAGHEFLDATRDNAVWKKVTERVLKGGASWTFDLVKEWAKHEVRSRLGLPE